MNKDIYHPISFNQVKLDDAFWAPKIDINRQVTIPIEYGQCKDTGRLDAFKLDWKPGMEPIPHVFWDSDVAKWIEAVSYSLSTHPDPELDVLLDEVIDLIASAQQPDGYLNTHFTVVEPNKRWTNLRDDHELYCAGHLMEAAVAHFQATGKRSLLDVLCRYADNIVKVFGLNPDQKRGYPGHEEIELALIKMYRVTGIEDYLKLSSYFVEERGAKPHYYDNEAINRGEEPSSFHFKDYGYMQAHIPVREQELVTGHAVRAMYLYSAMSDLAAELEDESLYRTCEKLWEHLCLKNMYITGGIGSTVKNEGFSSDYDLPNETAYCETCAAIGLVFWNWRLLQLKCDSRFADSMERAIYNNVLSGVSLDGKRFFYANPLASTRTSSQRSPSGFYERSEWFGCACCPPNLARILASLGGYLYTQTVKELAVHMYVQGEATLQFGDQEVIVHQQTQYPWDGDVCLKMQMQSAMELTIRFRIPAWCEACTVCVNGEKIDKHIKNGYLYIDRTWNSEDTVQLHMEMPVMRVYSHPDVRQNTGCVALQRGPIVYCIEEPDQEAPVHRIVLPRHAEITEQFEPELLGGVVILRGEALVIEDDGWEGLLYRTNEPRYKQCRLMAIPYYTWANRQPGEMKVWIPELP